MANGTESTRFYAAHKCRYVPPEVHQDRIAATIGVEGDNTMKPEPLPQQDTDLAVSIVGVWGLTTREDYDRNGNLLIDPHLGTDPIGMLAFSEDYFSAQFSKRDRSEPSEAVAVHTENNSSAVGGYDAYFGKYWVDETGEAIVVHLEGSITRPTPAKNSPELPELQRINS